MGATIRMLAVLPAGPSKEAAEQRLIEGIQALVDAHFIH